MNNFNNSEQIDDLTALSRQIRAWGQALGFAALGVADIDLSREEASLADWLAAGYHGDMDYMARHGGKRARPAELVPGTQRAIVARMDYLHAPLLPSKAQHSDAKHAAIARYAHGRDYHKLIRNRLQALTEQIDAAAPGHHYRVFCDSAPVMEVALAEKAGLGWRGKHTLLLDRERGSFFFSGRSIPTCCSRWMRHSATIAAAARSASISAQPRPSLNRSNSTPAAVFPT